jgi:hypothetical protein
LKKVCSYQNWLYICIIKKQLKTKKMTTLIEAKADAKKVMTANNLPFATIWKTGKSYGFNFDKKDIGFSVKEAGVKRTVVDIVK